MNYNDNTNLKYTITLDPTPQDQKPSKKQMGIISNNLKLVTGLTIDEFVTYTSQPYSYTWAGGIFNGSLNNNNWFQQSVFALDFDNGYIDLADTLYRLNKIDIFPQLWYNTFSDSPQLRKFRVVFFVDTPVKDEATRKFITTALLELFPEADRQCKNACRFFLSGRQSYVLNKKPIQLKRLVDILSIELITKDGGRTRKIPAEHITSSTESGKKRAFLYNSNRSSQISPDFNKKTTSLEGGEVIDFEVARQRVKIFDAFLSGEWLYHDQLFGLATNLIYTRGGRKLMKETMEYYNQTGMTLYNENNFNIITYLNKVSYPPQPIHTFSPYPQDQDLYDLISTTKDQRGFIEQIEPIDKISLEEAEKKFVQGFREVIKDPSSGKIHLFILPTAIGKTQSILSNTATIAVPTNDLKEEIAARMEVDYLTTPDAVVFENEIINRKIQYYYTIGLPKKATAVLYDVINEKNKFKYSSADIEKASNYISQLKASYISSHTILTTHSRALQSEFFHETIIFDEDPLKSLLDIKQLSISDLQKLDNQTRLLNNDLNVVIDFLKSTTPGEIKATPILNIDLDKLVEKLSFTSIDSNIFEFFASSFFIRDTYDNDMINYVVKRELPVNKKIVILSATIPLYIYQRLYGDRLNVIDIRDVVQKGSIIQHTKRSCSRSGLSRYCDQISEEVGDRPVITFKDYKKLFKNPVMNMHFGNCSGYDTMKGKDLVVVGTPHRNNVEYLLTAKVLGIDFKTMDTTMSHQKIEYNGFRYAFNCYDHKELRSIQLALIESDLIQAVGRARTLRTDANVEVYSNFPLRISDRFIY